MDAQEVKRLKTMAHNMRLHSLDMALAAGAEGAHLGGGLSSIEILAVLYGDILRIQPENPEWEERDRFILSKGHGALAYYAALMEVGIVSPEELQSYKSDDTQLYGHPSMNMKRGIEFSSGSLGQGLSLGVGSAMALKWKKQLAPKVYVVLGDGECDEGSIWEAAARAAHYHQDNLVVIVDKNGLQYDGPTSEVMDMGDLAQKFACFGFDTVSVDGHDVEALHQALSRKVDRPAAVIANTVKGKGVSFMENNPLWHHAKLTQAQYEQAVAEQEEQA